MSIVRLANSVRSFLSTHYMLVDDDWINGFVEYAIESSDNTISDDDVRSLAREQWLLNDLKDICPGSLPADLSRHLNTVLNGKYVLQINAAIDIGTPKYQQYLKLQKVNMENIEITTKFEDKVPSHRMIKLSLTDGVQNISAIEYKPMRNLSCDITPGCKILIKGPVECRQGILLLKESTVELLGGEVKEIIESSSLAGLLSAKLNLPIIKESDPNMSINPSRNTDIPTPHIHMPPAQSDVDLESIHQTSRPVAVVTSLQVAYYNNDVIDINELDDIEAQFENPSKRPSTDTSFNPEKRVKIDSVNQPDDYPDDIDFIIDEDEEYFREIENDIRNLEHKKPIQTTSRNVEVPRGPILTSLGNVEPTPKVPIQTTFRNDEVPKGPILKPPRNVEVSIGPILTSLEPYIFIKQINDLTENERSGRVFKVKAQILKLLSKLYVSKDGWSLKCTIVDGTGSLDVDFTSEVLAKLVGYSHQEMDQLRKEMAIQPELKEKVIAALQKAKETLQMLNCIIEVTMFKEPKITCLTPFDSKCVDLLKSRMNKTGL